MKKLIINYLILLSFCFLNAEIFNPNSFQFVNNEHITIEYSEQPFFTFYHKDLIMKTYENKETEIIYENSQRITNNGNTRDTLLRLHFNDSYPSFFIINEDYFFSDWDANWIEETTAEISMPSGIYKIFTVFNIESLYKMVIRYDVDLTFGPGLHEFWIDHNEATNILELNSCDMNGDPFDMSEKYYANFHFHFYNENFSYILTHTFMNQIATSEFHEGFSFTASELKFDNENVHITQYGPIQTINSSILFSNDPVDYSSQQLLLNIPQVNDDIGASFGNTVWFSTNNNPFYMGSFSSNEFIECQENEWNINLYMMNQDYEYLGSTFMIYLGYWEDYEWHSIYNTAPFHCIDNEIGSFWNSIPIIVDYLSPDGEQLVFGEAPIYMEVYHYYFNNLLYIGIEHRGFNKESRDFDVDNSTFNLTDSNGNIIVEGELSDLWELNLLEDIYTLTLEDNNFNLAGLSGTCTLINYFNTALELPKPPVINSLTIFNEDNKPVNRLEYNENATLLFTVADVEYTDSTHTSTYYPVVTDSVKVFYKLHEEEDWLEIETDLIAEFPELGWTFGKVFSTDLSATTTIDSVAYDLKIHFEDNEENYTEMVLEPAFIVGDFDATSLSEDEFQTPRLILSNYPNPFNPETTIEFNLIEDGEVQLDIYNIKGQKIKQLEISNLKLGINNVIWNGTDENNKSVSSGIYIYQLKVNGKVQTSKKCLLLK